jgi:hypothetical protein
MKAGELMRCEQCGKVHRIFRIGERLLVRCGPAVFLADEVVVRSVSSTPMRRCGDAAHVIAPARSVHIS